MMGEQSRYMKLSLSSEGGFVRIANDAQKKVRAG